IDGADAEREREPRNPEPSPSRGGLGGDGGVVAPAFVALAILCILFLSGCGRSTGDGTTLKFWTIGREGEVVAQLLPEFERAHSGVHVQVQQIPLTAAHEKLLTAFAGDALPDICQLGNTWIPEFAALGALEPLQPYVDASNIVD